MMGGCLGMKVPGSSQLKWLPKAARGGAGPGEPGSSIGSFGRRGVESTCAGGAPGTVGVGGFSPLSREALGNARGATGTGHVPRGRGRGVRGGERTCAGRSLHQRERACTNDLACKTHIWLPPLFFNPSKNWPLQSRARFSFYETHQSGRYRISPICDGCWRAYSPGSECT